MIVGMLYLLDNRNPSNYLAEIKLSGYPVLLFSFQIKKPLNILDIVKQK